MTVRPLFRRRATPLYDPDPHSSSRPPFAWPRSRSGRLPDRRSACVAMPARCGADAVPIGQLVARSETCPNFKAEPSRCTSAVHFDAWERRSSTFAQAAKTTEVIDHAAKLDLPRDARFGSDPLASDARAANLKSVSSATPIAFWDHEHARRSHCFPLERRSGTAHLLTTKASAALGGSRSAWFRRRAPDSARGTNGQSVCASIL
jgi:hypothetical protein